MSTVAELENAVPKLSRSELDDFRRWFEDYLESQMELRDEVVAAIEQSKGEIAVGNFHTRQP